MRPFFCLFALLFTLALNAQTDSLRPKTDSLKSVATDTLKPLPPKLPAADTSYKETGIASWYGQKFEGRYTSSGEIFRVDSLTAAHKKLPFGTLVKVTNLKNDSVVIVKITDRLPQNSTRCIDLTPRAARQLNFLRAGLTPVRLEVVGSAPLYKKKKTPAAKSKTAAKPAAAPAKK
ncbi:MAG: septal ring lytic transglycosylase RlpA family protein [Bacteroidia bacterium]|jgi:rare lipoprotein A|nr:septal ring lytic transglycosylase RlpA family protein [Bacteroidia bacterium]